jgi:hypothetical protein
MGRGTSGLAVWGEYARGRGTSCLTAMERGTSGFAARGRGTSGLPARGRDEGEFGR